MIRSLTGSLNSREFMGQVQEGVAESMRIGGTCGETLTGSAVVAGLSLGDRLRECRRIQVAELTGSEILPHLGCLALETTVESFMMDKR